MKIAVLGGAGRMGTLLVGDLHSLSNDLVVSDPNVAALKKLCQRSGVESALSNSQAVSNADVVIIAVPMSLTTQVIQEVVSCMKTNAVLCEISSIKHGIYDILQNLGRTDVSPLCLHPLFGEGAKSLRKKMAVIPVFDEVKERETASEIFPEYETFVIPVEEHDKAMAFTISLPYFVNLILASVLQNKDIRHLQMLGGTTFRVQLMLAGSVMFNSCRLHEELHSHNPHVVGVLQNFQRELTSGMRALLDEGADFKKFCSGIKADFGEVIDLAEKYEEMYQLLGMLDRRLSPELGP